MKPTSRTHTEKHTVGHVTITAYYRLAHRWDMPDHDGTARAADADDVVITVFVNIVGLGEKGRLELTHPLKWTGAKETFTVVDGRTAMAQARKVVDEFCADVRRLLDTRRLIEISRHRALVDAAAGTPFEREDTED